MFYSSVECLLLIFLLASETSFKKTGPMFMPLVVSPSVARHKHLWSKVVEAMTDLFFAVLPVLATLGSFDRPVKNHDVCGSVPYFKNLLLLKWHCNIAVVFISEIRKSCTKWLKWRSRLRDNAQQTKFIIFSARQRVKRQEYFYKKYSRTFLYGQAAHLLHQPEFFTLGMDFRFQGGIGRDVGCDKLRFSVGCFTVMNNAVIPLLCLEEQII